MSSFLTQVQARTWRCASVSCNCGVAVKEGDDVIVVDMCRDRIPRARFASKKEPAPGARVRRDPSGKIFIVSMITFDLYLPQFYFIRSIRVVDSIMSPRVQ